MNPNKRYLRFILIMYVIIGSMNCISAQTTTLNYKLIKTIEHPKGFKFASIHEIYIDSTSNIIAISYGGKVKTIYIYNLDNWNLIDKIPMDFVMLDLSFTDYTNNDIYFYEDRKQYSTYNISTKKISKYKLKKNEELPKGFYKNEYIEPKDSYYGDNGLITYKGWYIIVNTPMQGEIYMKP